MKHRSFAGTKPAKNLSEHLFNHGRQRALRDLVRNDRTVVQVHHRREVELSIVDLELSHVRHPFLVRLIGREITLQMVGCGLADRAREGLVTLGPNQRLQLHRDHQFLNRLVINRPAGPFQLDGYAAVSVPASVQIEDLADLGPQIAVLIDGLESPLLIVEATAWADQQSAADRRAGNEASARSRSASFHGH